MPLCALVQFSFGFVLSTVNKPLTTASGRVSCAHSHMEHPLRGMEMFMLSPLFLQCIFIFLFVLFYVKPT